jgi:GDP-L-fucose synthase
MVFELAGKKIWVAGHTGMLGAAICRKLNELDIEPLTVSRAELDLARQAPTVMWMKQHKPDVVFIAAARVGGIFANDTYPVEFLYENLSISANIINAATEIGVEKLMFMGTGCAYPKNCPQPIKESYLLASPLEPTNEWYAVAKITAIKLCQAYKKERGHNFISVMPTNLYGPRDNFDFDTSHFLPALIHKIHIAKQNNQKQISLWGSGKPQRELMYVDDCADAVIHIMKHYDEIDPINIGTGLDRSITEIAQMAALALNWDGDFVYDSSKPDGTRRKILDTSKLKSLGWESKINLDVGIKMLYDWFLENEEQIQQKIKQKSFIQ